MIGYTLGGLFGLGITVALAGAVFGSPVLYEAGCAVALVVGVVVFVGIARAARYA